MTMNLSTETTATAQVQVMLHALGIAVHRRGYQQLCIGIPLYARDVTQSLTKELYPTIARELGYPDWRSVERAIRSAICDAWGNSRSAVWAVYFPDARKPPSNKEFIATLAERIQ